MSIPFNIGPQIYTEVPTPTSMLRDALSYMYNLTVRSYLPRRIRVFNGVAARSEQRMLDLEYDPAVPQYEQPLCDAIRKNVKKNDDVVVVGGGKGVSTVLSLEHSHLEGTATVIEASERQCSDIREVLRWHGLSNRAEVRHASIGEIRNAYGTLGHPTELSAEDIPDCDVLVMDCEGAEKRILSNLDSRPRVIVTETHGCFDSPTQRAITRLREMRYETDLVGWEDEAQDVAVLTSTFSE